MRKGSKPCRLRPVGSIAGVRSTSPPGAGRTKRPSSALRMRRDLVVLGQQAVGGGELAQHGQRGSPAVGPARVERGLRRRARRPAPLWPRARAGRHAPTRRSTAAGRCAPPRLAAWPTTCRPCGISVYSSSRIASPSAHDLALGVPAPGRLGRRQVDAPRPGPGSGPRGRRARSRGVGRPGRASARSRP